MPPRRVWTGISTDSPCRPSDSCSTFCVGRIRMEGSSVRSRRREHGRRQSPKGVDVSGGQGSTLEDVCMLPPANSPLACSNARRVN